MLLSRKQAIVLNETRYFTGKSCKHGHTAQRFVRNRQCIECKKLGKIEWYKKNPEKIKAIDERRAAKKKISAIVWRLKNKKRLSLINKVWRQTNKDAYNAIHHARRARERGSEGRYTADDVKNLLKVQKHLCVCGTSFKQIKHTVDHKTPLSRGGSNWSRNLQLLCQPCNDSKGTKTQAEWLNCKVAA